MTDEVNEPAHYLGLKEALNIEVIDLIEAMGWGYHLGNVTKYLFRHEYKNNHVQDLKKARWYLDRYIEHVEADPFEEKPLLVTDNSHDTFVVGEEVYSTLTGRTGTIVGFQQRGDSVYAELNTGDITHVSYLRLL